MGRRVVEMERGRDGDVRCREVRRSGVEMCCVCACACACACACVCGVDVLRGGGCGW